jgi:hypothetical protein
MHSVLVDYNDNLVKVYNMLSTHAIYFISKRFKERIINEFSKFSSRHYNADILIERTQRFYNIYACKKILFYQSNRFNAPHDLEIATKFDLVKGVHYF